MTKKALQKQVDELRVRIEVLEATRITAAPSIQSVPYPQPVYMYTGNPLPFPCPTTTHI
jgi:hypothetical protein